MPAPLAEADGGDYAAPPPAEPAAGFPHWDPNEGPPPLEGMEGHGKKLEDLSETQIEKLMGGYHKDGYLGTFAADEGDKIVDHLALTKKPTWVSWVMNTDNRSGPGKHWQAVLINTGQNKLGAPSAEFYDSFGEPPSEAVTRTMKKVVEKLKVPVFLKFKVNRVQNQKDSSGSCGAMCTRFLKERLNGISFKSATNFTPEEGERLAADQKGGRFGFI
jgi:hypothetical protein